MSSASAVQALGGFNFLLVLRFIRLGIYIMILILIIKALKIYVY